MGSLLRSFLISNYGLFIDLSRAAENLINVQPSLQDLLLLSQQLIPICSEEGGRSRGLWSINGFQSIIEVHGVITVCVALDFIGLLAILCALHHAKVLLHLSFSVCKDI